jgi:hypothetical protein
MQEEQDSNAAQYSKGTAVSRTVTKGSHLYKNSTWDLVDAEKEQGFSYDDLKKDDLPKELKGKTKSELKAFVNKQRMERNRVQSEIAKYNKKRREFISQAKSETLNGLKSVMIEAIKKQAQKKNYSWN